MGAMRVWLKRPWVLGILISSGLGFLVFTATAEIGLEDPCHKACEQAHTVCLDGCSEHSNPMECDSQCNSELSDCRMACG
jgi:hypothetical protein